MTVFSPAQSVAFVDDDDILRIANVQALELAGLDAKPFADAESALREIDAGFAGVVVTDIRMPRMDGMQLFRRLQAIDPEIPVLFITGHGDVPMAVAALKNGAFDFLTKPFAPDHLIASVRKALETRRLVLDNRRLRQAAQEAEESGPLIGETPAMQRLRETIRQVAQADIDVLIEGETGTGKELAAILLHRWGPRRGRPFVAVNCGALPEAIAESELFGHEYGAVAHARSSHQGRIESANRGTLFLDEIESMSQAVQPKLLRVLEEREILPLGAGEPRVVDIRVIAASKVDLKESIARGDFRQDLFYRLNVVQLRIPPLRERREDIPLLFSHFLTEAAAQFHREPPRLSIAVRKHLTGHDWPGNVRELKHFAHRFALGLDDGGDDGPSPLAGRPGQSLPEQVEQFEASVIRDVLAQCRGDVRSALAALGIPRKTFYDKLSRHGIDINAFRRP